MRKRKLTKKRKRTKITKRLKRSKRLKRKNIVGGSSEAGQVEMNPMGDSTCRYMESIPGEEAVAVEAGGGTPTKETLNWKWHISDDNIRRQQSELKRASNRLGKKRWKWLKNYSIPRNEFQTIIDSIYRKYMISGALAQNPAQIAALGESVLEAEIGPWLLPELQAAYPPPTINEIIHILQGIKIKD